MTPLTFFIAFLCIDFFLLKILGVFGEKYSFWNWKIKNSFEKNHRPCRGLLAVKNLCQTFWKFEYFSFKNAIFKRKLEDFLDFCRNTPKSRTFSGFVTYHGAQIFVTRGMLKIAEFVINHEIWEHWTLTKKFFRLKAPFPRSQKRRTLWDFWRFSEKLSWRYK